MTRRVQRIASIPGLGLTHLAESCSVLAHPGPVQAKVQRFQALAAARKKLRGCEIRNLQRFQALAPEVRSGVRACKLRAKS